MTDNHPYEQRITGDGENWGEIMADAFDGLMASASESCTTEELDALESHIAATLGGRKLTAEQVREAIERHAIPLLGRMWQFIDRSYEAIADELNAALGGVMNPDGLPIGLTISNDGTLLNWEGENYVLQSIARDVKRKPNGNAALGVGECEWQLEHSGTLYDKWRCSECGYLFVESRTDHGIKEDFEPNYCPSCGRKVKMALPISECELEETFSHDVTGTVHVLECSSCGRTCEHVYGGYEYCPHCGRRVVER